MREREPRGPAASGRGGPRQRTAPRRARSDPELRRLALAMRPGGTSSRSASRAGRCSEWISRASPRTDSRTARQHAPVVVAAWQRGSRRFFETRTLATRSSTRPSSSARSRSATLARRRRAARAPCRASPGARRGPHRWAQPGGSRGLRVLALSRETSPHRDRAVLGGDLRCPRGSGDRSRRLRLEHAVHRVLRRPRGASSARRRSRRPRSRRPALRPCCRSRPRSPASPSAGRLRDAIRRAAEGSAPGTSAPAPSLAGEPRWARQADAWIAALHGEASR